MKKIALALLLASVTFQASATVVFTDRAAWTAATTLDKTVDFERVASAGSYKSVGSAYVNSGMTFSYGSQFVIDGAYDGGRDSTGTGAALYANGTSINLGGAYAAFAIDLRGYAGLADSFTITLSDREVFTLTSGAATVFFGVVLDKSITSLTIRTSNATAFDNVSVGAAKNAVPEPASAALLGLGLFGLALARRKSVK